LATANIRKRLEDHRKNPECVGCHGLFDAYGLALEHYDALGKFRSKYDDGTPIDASVTLPPPPSQSEGQVVDGLEELSAAVSADPAFGRCLARKLLTYGLGRAITASDDPHLQHAVEQWLTPGQTPSIGRLIHALVSTPAFLARRGGDEGSSQP
jgi:hypothetical protein